MAQEQTYQARVDPREGAALPMRSAREFGAGIGDQLADAGEQLHRRELRAYQLDRQEAAAREAADFDHRFALARQKLDDVRRKLRSEAGPGGAGHVEAVAKEAKAAEESLFAGITEEEVLRRARGQWQDYALRMAGAEGDFAEGQRVAKTVTDRIKAGDVSVNRIRRGMEPEAYGEELRINRDAIFGTPGLDDATREKLWNGYQQQAGVAFVQNLQDTNPGAARAMLDAGMFDHLDPQVLEQLRTGTDVEIRRQEAAAAQQAAMERSQLTEQVQTLTTKAEQGIDVADEAAALIPQVAETGDTSTVARLEGLVRDSQFARAYSGATPLQRQARVAELAAKPEASRSEAEQAELVWHRQRGGALDSAFSGDPVAWAMQNAPEGMKPPALEAGLAARAEWATKVRGVYGPVKLLSGAEADMLRLRMAEGDAGYMQVMADLSAMPPVARVAAARQVAPQDRYFQQLVSLPEQYRRLAVDGKATRTARPKIVIPAPRHEEAIEARVNGLHQALAAVPVAQREAVLELARNIAARDLQIKGREDEAMDERTWQVAVNLALGATGNDDNRRGGLAQWGDSWFLVPERQTRQQFTDSVFAAARRAGPVNPDGSPASLRSARPVWMGGSEYQFWLGNRVLVGKDGQPWTFDAGGAR